MNSGIATCLNRAIGTTGLAPAGLRPCRLLRRPGRRKKQNRETLNTENLSRFERIVWMAVFRKKLKRL